MKIFLLIYLASGLASSEKLDRSYLPPPGSKFSGGSPGDIQVPFEFPKETYTTVRPVIDGKPDIELGINRRPGLPTGTPERQQPGFTYFQNSYPIPKTTTSYAITQTTTFPPADNYEGLNQPTGFSNVSTGIQSGFPGQTYQQPISKPGQEGFNQYRPGQGQPTTLPPYGTTARPFFPGLQKGLEYLPPVPTSGNKGQAPGQVISKQDDFGYPSGQSQGPKYQDGQSTLSETISNQPGYLSPGSYQQSQYIGSQNLPSSSAAPQYQGGRFGSQQTQYQFPGSQFPPTTAAPQYQAGQRLSTPGSIQQNQFLNQDYLSSTAEPRIPIGQFTTPGLNQQLGTRVPYRQNQYTETQYQDNQNFSSSTIAPTPGFVQESQYPGNQKFPSTAAPNYQERFTTSGQNQGGFLPGQQKFGSRLPNKQSQYVGNQIFPSSTAIPDGASFTTPRYEQEGYRSTAPAQQNQYQYPEIPNFPTSTTAPRYQDSQKFTTPGQVQQNQYPENQNLQSTAAPNYQGGQPFTTPSQFPGELIPGQQRFGIRIPSQQNQNAGNQDIPSSTTAPQYQNGQRFITPGSQQTFESSQENQQNQYPGSQSFPSSTTIPQYQDQRFINPGQQPLLNQQTYPGSTAVPQYQQTFAPTPGTNQPGFIPSQQNQYQRPSYNQQILTSTAAPQGFIPGSQPQYGNDGIQSTPGTAVSFPESQGGLTGIQSASTYGNTQQPTSQAEAGSSVYGTAPSVPTRFSNQGFPSTTVGTQPGRDFPSTPGFGNVGENRPERPQAESDRYAEIINYENVLTPEGYSYSYDTSNGIHADETGTVGDGTRAQGGFSYTGDDGKVYSVFYSADENGFQPQGDHLPTAPPIPEAIQRVIDQANKDKESGIDDDGSYNEDKYGYMKYERPLTRLRPKNKTESTVNGADIPDLNRNRVGGENKVFKPKESNQDSGEYSEAEISEKFISNLGSELEDDDINGEQRGETNNQKNEKETLRRIGTKRPKPVKSLTVEDNRPNRMRGNKTPMKLNINSKVGLLQNNESSPVSSKADEESDDVTDITEDQRNNDDLQESQESDYDSDLISYRDDPNNRTDFHGLNKYLPRPKGKTRKNQQGNKRPTVQVGDIMRPVVVHKNGSPENRYNQASLENESDFIDEARTDFPTRKNKVGQKIKDQSKGTNQPGLFDSEDQTNVYDNDSDDTKQYGSDKETRPNTVAMSKSGTSQLKMKVSGKPKRPSVNGQTEIPENNNIKTLNEETGYDYPPPQRKFESEGALKFPSKRPVSEKPKLQNGIQTTLRPFMTKNVYGDDDESLDENIDQEYDAGKPGRLGRPMTTQKQQYSEINQDENRNNENVNPEVSEDDQFAITRRPVGPDGTPSRRPFGRPQTTALPQYDGQSVTDQERYNEPFNILGSQKPRDKILYNTNAPSRGTSIGGNIFSSTTPLPSPASDIIKQYQRPGQLQNRPTDISNYYDEKMSPDGETYVNKPGANRTTPGKLPSTTYRPNYSFGDRTLAPSGPVTVDGYGRPISSTEAPTIDGNAKPTYSTTRPSISDRLNNRPNAGDNFRPTVGRFGVTAPTQGTSGYQSSTSAPLGEDFSGPKQPQRFDSESGYYYR